MLNRQVSQVSNSKIESEAINVEKTQDIATAGFDLDYTASSQK